MEEPQQTRDVSSYYFIDRHLLKIDAMDADMKKEIQSAKETW